MRALRSRVTAIKPLLIHFDQVKLGKFLKQHVRYHAHPAEGMGPDHRIDDQELRNAAERGEFTHHYQPRINLANGSVVGLEALAGWNHPKQGLVLPESSPSSISAQDSRGEVSLQFVERTLSEFRTFAEKNQEILRLTFKLHAASLVEVEFPDRLVPLAKRFGVPLHKIGIDVSGIGSLDQVSSGLGAMTRLRMKGVELAVGEYGGAIGIQQLRQISASELKIDGGIVQNIFVSERDSTMAQMLILIAHELNIEAVAEGVETEQQLEFLRQHGCDYAHGYYFGHPLRTEEMAAWLKAYRPRPSSGNIPH